VAANEGNGRKTPPFTKIEVNSLNITERTSSNATKKGENIPNRGQKWSNQRNDHQSNYGLFIARLILLIQWEMNIWGAFFKYRHTSHHFSQASFASLELKWICPDVSNEMAHPKGNIPFEMVSLMICPGSVEFSSARIVRQP
jgi:hypothetical protein